jgi:hypothetical protein
MRSITARINAEVFSSQPSDIKLLMAIGYLENSASYDKDAFAHFTKYCKAQTKRLIPPIMAHDNLAAMNGYAEIGGLSIKNYETIFADAQTANAAQIIAFLLEYRDKHFSESDKAALELKKTLNPGPAIIKLTISRSGVLKKIKWENGETHIDVPTGVKEIGEKAFLDCAALKTITLPDGLTRIWPKAFSGCKALTSIVLPDSVMEIGDRAFYGCKSLTAITIPDGVTKLENSTFSECKSLASVTLPKSMTSLDRYAFSDCESLASVTIPTSVTGIYRGAFSGCKALKSITIPDGVRYISEEVFANCRSLTSVTIPDSVKIIAESAFYNTALTSITLPDSVESIDEDAFFNSKFQKIDVTYTGLRSISVRVNEKIFSDFAPDIKALIAIGYLENYTSYETGSFEHFA